MLFLIEVTPTPTGRCYPVRIVSGGSVLLLHMESVRWSKRAEAFPGVRTGLFASHLADGASVLKSPDGPAATEVSSVHSRENKQNVKKGAKRALT